MKHLFIFIFLLLTIIVCNQMVVGQIPRTISYQGVLTDNTGTPKPDGSYQITFRLYDAENGGNVLWTEVKTLLTKKGLFSTALGDQVPFPYSMKFNQPYWLSIQVAADPELTPRIKLNAVGYSLNSSWADTARVGLINIEKIDTLILGSDTQDGRLIINKSGSSNPIVESGNYSGYGGSVLIKDEIGKNIGEFRPSTMGTGGTLLLYRDTLGNNGFYAGGNAYGDQEGYMQVYGSQRSAILYMGASRNASVVLPDSSISSQEILDEPGVATKYGPSFYFLSNNTNNQIIDSLILNLPAAGKVIVDATGYVNIFHTNGTPDNIAFNVVIDPDTYIFTYGVSSILIPSIEPGTNTIYRYPFACKNIFNIISPTTLKVYLIVRHANGANISSTQVGYSVINAVYYPTTYGNTPVLTSGYIIETDGTLTSNQPQQDYVRYETAEEFNSAKVRQFQEELEQLKTRLKSLESKRGSDLYNERD